MSPVNIAIAAYFGCNSPTPFTTLMEVTECVCVSKVRVQSPKSLTQARAVRSAEPVYSRRFTSCMHVMDSS